MLLVPRSATLARSVLSAVLFASTAAAAPPATLGLEARVRAFDAYAAKGVAVWKVPGLAVAVVKDGRVVLARAYGVRELGRPEPATTRTLFAVGSTTKAMTAADYADALYGKAKVVADGSGLQLVLGQELGGRLEHWHYDTYKTVPDLAWVDPVYVRFGVDAQGRVSRLVLGDLVRPEEAWASFARQEEKK